MDSEKTYYSIVITLIILCVALSLFVSISVINDRKTQIRAYDELIKSLPDTRDNRQCAVLFRYCLRAGINVYDCGNDLRQCLRPVRN